MLLSVYKPFTDGAKKLTYQKPENGHIFIAVERPCRVCGLYLYGLGEQWKTVGLAVGKAAKF